MSAGRQIRELKRVLALEADLQRGMLRGELLHAFARVREVKERINKIRAASPWIALGAAGVGILAGKRRHSLAEWISAALSALECVQKLRPK